jgi:hypothetical protein
MSPAKAAKVLQRQHMRELLADRDATIARLHSELATLRETVVTTNAVAADAMRESASLRAELEAAKTAEARALDASRAQLVFLTDQLVTLQGERDALRERLTEELGEVFKLTRITSGGLPFVNYEAVSLHVSRALRALAATPPLTPEGPTTAPVAGAEALTPVPVSGQQIQQERSLKSPVAGKGDGPTVAGIQRRDPSQKM